MQIIKQYIEEKLLNKRGWLNANYHKMVSLSREELYLIYNEIDDVPLCIGKNKKNFVSFTKGYSSTCGSKDCLCYKDRYKRTQETLKKTNLEKYGVEHYPGNIKKKKETCLKKYGNETYRNISKQKQTKLDKYGSEIYNNTDIAQVKRRESIKEFGQWIPLDKNQTGNYIN